MSDPRGAGGGQYRAGQGVGEPGGAGECRAWEAHATMDTGMAKRSSSMAITTAPQTRELVPVRKVKMVVEKM